MYIYVSESGWLRNGKGEKKDLVPEMSPRSDEQRSFGHDQKKEKILTSGLLSKYRDKVYSSDIKLSI